jgi:hypothetical protein
MPMGTSVTSPRPVSARSQKPVLNEYERVEGLPDLLLAQPLTGEAHGHLPGTIDDWLEMARRGLFSYDWKHWSGPYRRAATPTSPITIELLPAGMKDAVNVVRLIGVRFPDWFELRPEELCECE